MKLKEIFNNISKFAEKNSMAILTGTTMIGVALTAYTTAKAAIKVHEAMKCYKTDKEDALRNNKPELVEEIQKECIKTVTFAVIPPVIVGAGTMFGIWQQNRVSSNKIKMLSSLYSVSQMNLESTQNKLESLKDTMKEKLGDKKAHEIENRDIEKRGQEIQLGPVDQARLSAGQYPCVDLYHDKRVIFYTTQTEAERAINAISSRCFHEGSVSVWDLYYELEVNNIPTNLQDIGWTSDCLIEGNLPITVTTFLHPSGVPCLALDYEPEAFFRQVQRYRH